MVKKKIKIPIYKNQNYNSVSNYVNTSSSFQHNKLNPYQGMLSML